jgi:glycosyltransferase involved in cell wall biosynthesis
MTRVSVVVPTFRRAASLPKLIEAFEAQTLPVEDFEVIVADDASPDDTPAVLEDLASRTAFTLRVVRNARNKGPGAARNLAWRAASSPIIAFTDDDCLPSPEWLESGLARFDRSSAGRSSAGRSSADIVQGRTLPDPAAPKKGWAKTVRVERFTKLYESCNIFYRTDVLRSVGGFDEEIKVPFGEDTAAGWKAIQHGFTAEFAADALVYHSVTYPSARYWWRYAMMHRNFPMLVRRFPEMRQELLWLRFFLWRERAVFDAALAGIAGGIVWWPAFALALPYAYVRFPRKLTRADITSALSQIALDPAILAGLLLGSFRERTLVL